LCTAACDREQGRAEIWAPIGIASVADARLEREGDEFRNRVGRSDFEFVTPGDENGGAIFADGIG